MITTFWVIIIKVRVGSYWHNNRIVYRGPTSMYGTVNHTVRVITQEILLMWILCTILYRTILSHFETRPFPKHPLYNTTIIVYTSLIWCYHYSSFPIKFQNLHLSVRIGPYLSCFQYNPCRKFSRPFLKTMLYFQTRKWI